MCSSDLSRWSQSHRAQLPTDHILSVVGTSSPHALNGKTAVAADRMPGAIRTSIAVEGVFKAAFDAHNAGAIDAAAKGYRRVLSMDPGHRGALKFLAKIQLRAGDRSGALRYLQPLSDDAATDKAVADMLLKTSPHPPPGGARAIGGLFKAEHFVGVTDRERAKQLFARSVRNIDLELFSYCNRRCLYCPNSFIDRISTNNYLPGPVYQMIVRDLSEIGYKGKITLNFYNEPMADPVTLEACRELRAVLPTASIRMNTNGDYLNAGSLEEIRDAGMKHLMISLHVSSVVDWDDEKVKFRAEQIYDRIGVRPEEIDFRPGEFYRAMIPFKGMKVEVVQGNYSEFGYNIGGLMRHIPAPSERTSPCDEPFKSMTVTYNGNLTPCCRIRGDADDHKSYVTANLADYGSIYEAWANEALAGWRRHLLGFNSKSAPCHGCKAVQVADTRAERQLRANAARLIQIEEPELI